MQLTVEMSKDCADSKLYLLELQGRLICHAGNSFAGHPLGGLGFKDDGTPFIVIGRQLLYGEVVDLPKPVVALRKKVPSESGERGFDVVAVMRPVDGSLQEIERHLEMGKQYLSKGQFSDAIMHYDAALELDPDNYMTLYRRATAYLANGRSKSAIPDLNKVVELKPDFVAARLQRGSILLKQGDLDAAEKDFQTVINRDQSSRDAEENIRRAMPWSERLRLKRAECYEHLGALQKAISDIRSATRLVPDNTKAMYKASQFSYMLGNLHDAIEGIRECLKIDPDQRECFTFYKKLKRLVKVHDSVLDASAKEQWKLCLDGTGQMLKQESEVTAVIMLAKKAQCKCLGMVGQLDDAIRVCSEVLEKNPNELPTLLNRAEVYIQNNEFEQAIHDYQKALQIDEDNQAARAGLKKAQNLLKQSKKKDYYKILGVKRNADKATIIKAYRKLAQKWHPDNFDKDEKKKAEERFIDIAAAKEVLTDPDKRAQYDSGVDPLDPEAQQQAHHPFYQYFQGFDAPFDQGGGPFTFKFHFQ
ncbi:tetratricopeptide repeat protein [Trichuris suis]|nr:tetratricopeptide repeat protein [Trichuris suis]